MDTNEIILGLVALVLILFSLVVSILVPRRDAGFPGRSMGAFVVVCVLLVGGMLASVEVLGEGHEVAHAEAGAEETGAAETGGGGDTGGAEQAAGDAAAGEQVFQQAGCGTCHTLAAAGTTGTVGPNLDEAMPPHDLVVERVTNGMGAMPSFADQLSEQQIQDVAAYVVASTSG